MNAKIRTYGDTKRIQLCKHISIDGVETEEVFPQCEYEDAIEVTCTVCKEKHIVTIAIN